MKESTRKKLALRRKQQQQAKQPPAEEQLDIFVEAEATTQVAAINEEIRGPDTEE